MVYVSSDGRVLQQKPWGLSRIVDIFTNAFNFVYFFFASLLGFDRPAVAGRSGSGGGRGGGPDGPDDGRRIRRVGKITTIQDCSMPGGG